MSYWILKKAKKPRLKYLGVGGSFDFNIGSSYCRDNSGIWWEYL